MAIAYLESKYIKRSEGRSFASAVAYRFAERVESEWDGNTYDFSGKCNVEYKEIMLPENAPEEFQNSVKFANAIEQSERSLNAQLARELVIALPLEFSREEQINITRDFVQTTCVNQGMCAAVAMHNPPLMDDMKRPIKEDGSLAKGISEYVYNNPHVHILLTLRPLDEDGRWMSKTEKEYVCRKSGEELEIKLTGRELVELKAEGWEKQYPYYHGRSKQWLTKAEAGYRKPINNSPKCTPYGRKNPTIVKWQSKEQIQIWKDSWARICNQRFAEKGCKERIDFRRYDNLEYGKIAQVHQGPAVTQAIRQRMRMDREGGAENAKSDIEQLNELIREHNGLVDKYEEGKCLVDQAMEIKSGRIEYLEAEIRDVSYALTQTAMEIARASEKKEYEQDEVKSLIRTIDSVSRLNEASMKIITNLVDILASLSSLEFVKRNNIEKRVSKEEESIKLRNQYVSKLLSRHGYRSKEEILSALNRKGNSTEEDDVKRLEKQIRELEDDLSREMLDIPEEYAQQLFEKRNEKKPKKDACKNKGRKV